MALSMQGDSVAGEVSKVGVVLDSSVVERTLPNPRAIGTRVDRAIFISYEYEYAIEFNPLSLATGIPLSLE